MLCVCMYKMGCFRSGRVGDFFVLFLSFEGFVLFGFLFFFFFFSRRGDTLDGVVVVIIYPCAAGYR